MDKRLESRSLLKMPFKVIVLCCLLAIANAGPRVSNWMPPLISTVGFPNKVTRVVGGNNAEVGEFPHQISLQYILSGVMTHICGGSIISEKWILTAGHCVFGLGEVSSFFVKAGKHNIMLEEDSEQKALIEDIFIHENYTGNVAPFDIALLKLKVPLKFNKRIAPIRLPAESGVEPVGYATVSGWGSISLTVNSTMPAILQKVKILIIDFKTCYAALLLSGEESKLHNTNFCTGPLNGGLGACQGDSGGPLVAKNKFGANELIGIVSWGFVPCGSAGSPSVFVKVSNFLNWINLTIAKNA